MEEQILRYYLGTFSFAFFLIYFYYIFFIQTFFDTKKLFIIDKGETIYNINKRLSDNKNLIINYSNFYVLNLYNKFKKPLNYGKFNIKENINLISLLKIISNKSNINYNITIVEGWEYFELENYLKKFYGKIERIPYENIISDTYKINSSNNFTHLKLFLEKQKNTFFKDYRDNEFIKKYGIEKLMIISSLVEKEAKNKNDKSLISSVIFNRLNLNMRLQIDATVIYSKTHGEFNYNKKLNYKDLKIEDPYNTYHIKELPPKMICYVGKETIKIVLESKKSNYLFYFYNILEKKHIFSKTFKEHKKKLYEYRKIKK